MILAALFISGRDWLLPAALLLGASLFILFWGYGRTPVSPGTRVASFLLKAVGLAVLGFCLLEPLWSSQRPIPGANFFALLADNSQGMQIKDKGESRSRGEVLKDLLNPDQGTWQAKLEELFQTRRFLFDTRLAGAKDWSGLDFEGRASGMGSSLRALGERYKGQPLAGILLFSDGNATDLVDASADWTGLPPIYPVVSGKDDPIRDISIQKVAVSQTAFEDAPVTVDVTVTPSGYAGVPVVAQLFEMADASRSVSPVTNKPAVKPPVVNTPSEAEGKKAAELTQTAPKEGEMMAFRFQVRPTKPGISFYRLRVSAKSEVEQFADAKLMTEATLANNSRMVVVDRGRGPYRILYVSGRPNWEFKFLNRALSEDDQVQLVALIRIAKREPKFNFLGNRGDASNPLFKGFDTKGEEVQSYDKPVLIRLNTVDQEELRDGFPKEAEDLFGYHAIIVDDLEAEFFTRDQMSLLQKYVSERGGGFLMLGGMESFAQGKYERTPIADMLPVYVDRPPTTGKPPKLNLSLSREGWLQPWVRLRSNEEEERERLMALPRGIFEVVNRVRDIKPGASVLATVKDEQGKDSPALIVQRFGRGRTAALTIGDMWKWGLHNEAMHKDMDKSWRQLARWLVAEVPNRVELVAQQNAQDENQSIALQVRTRDKKFQPLDNAAVKMNVRFVSARQEGVAGVSTNTARPVVETPKEVPVTVEASATEGGLYQSSYIPRETGGYLAEVTVTDSAGIAVGTAEAGWTADPAADEFRSLKPNRALLTALAKKTGGEVIDADKLADFVKSLSSRKTPVMESVSKPLWHTPWMFLIALACFTAEWGLRRWKGLA